MKALSKKQLECFETIWFIYGNDGPKCTLLNHKLIQGFYEYGEDRRQIYSYAHSRINEAHNLTMECLEVVNLVLNSDLKKAINIAKNKAK